MRQRTLTLDTASDDRVLPDTLLYCEECGENVLRSNKFDHEHDLTDSDTVTEAQRKQLEDKVPEEALIETQTYRVTFHYEYVETVTVEASHKSEAKEAAERKRDLRGEYMDTLHTERRAVGDASAATIDYLEEYGLLPEDHDVTQGDIEELIDS